VNTTCHLLLPVLYSPFSLVLYRESHRGGSAPICNTFDKRISAYFTTSSAKPAPGGSTGRHAARCDRRNQNRFWTTSTPIWSESSRGSYRRVPREKPSPTGCRTGRRWSTTVRVFDFFDSYVLLRHLSLLFSVPVCAHIQESHKLRKRRSRDR
jgi:hypothetical protein